jgi:hypothetical protein
LQRLAEEELWKQAETSRARADRIATLDRLLISYPDGIHAEKAHQRQAALLAQETDATLESNGAGEPNILPLVQRHVGMDAPGNDRGTWIRGIATLGDCERICLTDSGCAGYTYNGRRSTCILKDSVVALSRHGENPVTGVVLTRVGDRRHFLVVPTPTPGPLPSEALSSDEIEVANRLRRLFRQRYRLEGISGINVSITLCYSQVRNARLGFDALLYCIALDLSASRIASSLPSAEKSGSSRFNEVQQAHARATSIMRTMNIEDRALVLARAELIADQTGLETVMVKPKAAVPRRR